MLLWILAIAGAAALDRPVGRWVSEHRPIHWNDRGWKLFKRPGDFQYLIPVVILVGLLHRTRWGGAALVALASGLAGAMYSTKWVLGRSRPSAVFEPFVFHPFINGPRGFLGTPNLSFPSGHTCLAFAAATALGFLMPRWRWLFYVVAAGVGIERVMEFAHYPSDVVAGAALGFVSAIAARWILRRVIGGHSFAAPTRGETAQPADPDIKPGQAVG